MTVAWAYIRVSGDEQADRGLPVAGQREAIQDYAAAHDLSVARWFIDEARPGSSDHRDAFQEMMRGAHASPSPTQAILLWSWSRFARDQDDAHYWKASLRRHGVAIRDVSGETPEVPGFEYVLESLIHWKDEQRLREISHDARRGQQTLARMGYVPSGCRPPRGYRVEFVEVEITGRRRQVRRWVPDPEVWPLAERAWRLRLSEAGYKRILQECPGLYKTPGGFATFFRNRIYRGELWFGGTLIAVPAMVTPEEWGQVNHRREERHGGAYPRRKGGDYLLTGLLRCGLCGRALVGHRTSRQPRNDGYARAGWVGYRCPGRRSHDCDLPCIGAGPLEDAVIDQLLEDILSPETLAAQWEALQRSREAERPAIEARIAALERDLADADRAIARILDAIEQAPEVSALVSRLRDRQANRDALSRDLADARAVAQAANAGPPDVAALREELREALARRGDDPARLEAARAVLRQFVEEVRVDGQRVAIIRFRIPF